ncbi:MAG TPA: hypothetical protein PKD72_10200 [Gemmatales bacterium]|nr:hypothetical protein [Gemmatales bacterium]
MNLLILLSTILLAPAHPPEDEKFDSENQASGVRAPADDFFRDMISNTNARRSSPAREEYNAEDVKKIASMKDKEISVRGKVHEVFVPSSGSVAILNFGKDNRKCFKAVIYKSDFEKFDGGADGIKKKFTGKVVAVEGKVSIYEKDKLPQIIVKTPSQISLQ